MADDLQVAESGAATASTAMTAPLPASFPIPGANPSGALAHPAAAGVPAKPAPAKRSGLRRFIMPVLILAGLGYGGQKGYDYFVTGRFVVAARAAHIGAPPAGN